MSRIAVMRIERSEPGLERTGLCRPSASPARANLPCSGRPALGERVLQRRVGVDVREVVAVLADRGDARRHRAAAEPAQDVAVRREARPVMFDLDNPEAAVVVECARPQMQVDLADHCLLLGDTNTGGAPRFYSR